MIDIGVLQGLVEKSGSWYAYKGERIGQGKDNARNFLLQHPEHAAELETAIREKLLPKRRGDGMPGSETSQG